MGRRGDRRPKEVMNPGCPSDKRNLRNRLWQAGRDNDTDAPMNRSLAMNCLMQFRNTENRSVKKAKQLQNAPTRQTFSKAKCSVLIVAEAFTGNVPSAGKAPILIGSTALQTAG